jgi:DNA-binding transcriptional ArsR family regulator
MLSVVDLFAALADPNRRLLVEALAERNDQTLFELCVRLTSSGRTMSRQAVSKHLAVLRDAGLVATSARGRTTLHHLDRAAFGDARTWIDTVTATPEPEERA